ncbi:PstA family ABC transporter permease [Prevotella sp. AGR2160]|uniref:PstA family ABC transporter permease n=1 Tax=Prevotella sp. AGR2160 TaxID=1280674 RepID=UPI0003FE8E2D|nr:ABC transporter permease subunit [Prevotella sp. AGR2160]
MRYLEEKIFKVLMILSVLLVAFFVFSVIGSILWRGLPELTWQMITEVPQGGFYIGGEGGFLNAIVGSLEIVVASTVIGLFIAIPVVFYLNVYLKPTNWLARVARLAYDVLFGIPSIVYGAFGFTIMVWLGLRASLLGGIIVETLLVVPVLIRSIDEVARNIPRGLLESSYSLGATKLDTIGVVVREIAPAIATATLLAVGRSIGDAAGVMFTAGFSDRIPTHLSDPAATLPLSVFFQLSAPQTSVQDRAYAAAVILTMIVLILSLSGRFIMGKFGKNR